MCWTPVVGHPAGDYLFPGMGFSEPRLVDLDKDSTLRIVKTLRDFKRIIGPTDVFDTVNHFYRGDIDNDGKDELLYYGIICADGYWTIIWKSDGKGYLLLGELYGKIIGIGDSLHLCTLAPAIKGSECGFSNLYRITDETVDFISTVTVPRGLLIPESPPANKSIIISNSGGCLRTRPVINNSPTGSPAGQCGILRGNIVAEAHMGDKALITSSWSDQSGIRWWFMVLEGTPDSGNSNRGKAGAVKRLCGWINAAELEGQNAP
jgi:hypothetical protein